MDKLAVIATAYIRVTRFFKLKVSLLGLLLFAALFYQKIKKEG